MSCSLKVAKRVLEERYSKEEDELEITCKVISWSDHL